MLRDILWSWLILHIYSQLYKSGWLWGGGWLISSNPWNIMSSQLRIHKQEGYFFFNYLKGEEYSRVFMYLMWKRHSLSSLLSFSFHIYIYIYIYIYYGGIFFFNYLKGKEYSRVFMNLMWKRHSHLISSLPSCSFQIHEGPTIFFSF